MRLVKRFLIIVTALCLAISMAACASNGDSKDTADSADKNDGVSFSIKYKGTEIKLGAKSDSVISALGEPQEKMELKACGNKGMQVKYTYPSIYLYVLESDSGNTVDQIDFRDDLVSTSEGVAVGMSRSDVIAKCGEADSEDPTSLTYTKGNLNLIFGLDSNSKVNTIAYIRKGV